METKMRIIAGPCQHETLAQSAEIAKECKRVCDKHGIEYYFKASYDKANRTSASGKRGVGLQATMNDFQTLKDQYGIKTLTDVHNQNLVIGIHKLTAKPQSELAANGGFARAHEPDKDNIACVWPKRW